MKCLVSRVTLTTEVPPHNAVRGAVVLLVQLLPDMDRSILFCVIFLQGLRAHSTESCCISSNISAFLSPSFHHTWLLWASGWATATVSWREVRVQLKPRGSCYWYWSCGASKQPQASSWFWFLSIIYNFSLPIDFSSVSHMKNCKLSCVQYTWIMSRDLK